MGVGVCQAELRVGHSAIIAEEDMATKDKRLSLIKPEKKKIVVEALIAYYARERNEEIGMIAAEDILDCVLEQIGSDIFNKGVEETTKLIQERMTGVWLDVEALVKK